MSDNRISLMGEEQQKDQGEENFFNLERKIITTKCFNYIISQVKENKQKIYSYGDFNLLWKQVRCIKEITKEMQKSKISFDKTKVTENFSQMRENCEKSFSRLHDTDEGLLSEEELDELLKVFGKTMHCLNDNKFFKMRKYIYLNLEDSNTDFNKMSYLSSLNYHYIDTIMNNEKIFNKIKSTIYLESNWFYSKDSLAKLLEQMKKMHKNKVEKIWKKDTENNLKHHLTPYEMAQRNKYMHRILDNITIGEVINQ